MKPLEFEIGKIYEDQRDADPKYILTRIDERKLVSLHDRAVGEIHAVSGNWGGNYGEFSLSELSEEGMAMYLKHFPDALGCTCSNDQIFNGGCICGAFQREKA